MTSISRDISNKLSPFQIAALKKLKSIMDGLGLDFFVMGATARDILFEHLNGAHATRMTRDVDIAVCVADREEFNRLTESLLASGSFKRGNQKQRFVSGEVMLDIIPFGGIAGRDNQVFWPPEYDIRMSTIGLRDVFNHSITCRMNDDPLLDIRVVSLPGLAILKVVAWNDGYPERQKDADDLIFMIRKYGLRENIERLYGETEEEMLIEEGFDHRLACARLLGRDMAGISSPETADEVLKILDSELRSDGQYRLVGQMTRPGEDSVEIIALLEKVAMGFRETAGRRPEGPGVEE